jgi:hypothetical protein
MRRTDTDRGSDICEAGRRLGKGGGYSAGENHDGSGDDGDSSHGRSDAVITRDDRICGGDGVSDARGSRLRVAVAVLMAAAGKTAAEPVLVRMDTSTTA